MGFTAGTEEEKVPEPGGHTGLGSHVKGGIFKGKSEKSCQTQLSLQNLKSLGSVPRSQ